MVVDEEQGRHHRDEHTNGDTEHHHLLSDEITVAPPDPDAPAAKWYGGHRRTSHWPSLLRWSSDTNFAATIRSIFNYPEPGRELRSTAWLDGLRGLAAFEVFIFHYCDGWVENRMVWGPEETPVMGTSWWLLPFIRTLYSSGDAAVCLFFVISGYVLSHRLLKLIRQQKHSELWPALSSAVFRRFFRLYLPVAIETLILMLACRLFGLPKPAEYEPAPSLLLEFKRWWVSLVHLFMPLRWPALWQDVLNPYDGTISWTIPLEFFGSLVTYLVLLAVSRFQRMGVRQSIIAIIIVHAYAKDDWISAAFLLGMSLADWDLDGEERPTLIASRSWQRFRKFLYPALFALGFFLAGIPPGHLRLEYEGDRRIDTRPFYDWVSYPLAYFGIYNDRQADRYILTIAGIFSAIGVSRTPTLKRITTTRPVQYLGRISFGLYLCHIFMRAWLRPLNEVYLGIFGLTLDDLDALHRKASLRLFFAYCLYMLPAIPLNFIVAGLFERFIDAPSVRNAKRLDQWCLSSRLAVPTGLPISRQDAGIAMGEIDRSHGTALSTQPAPPARPSLPLPTEFEDETPLEESERKRSDTLL